MAKNTVNVAGMLEALRGRAVVGFTRGTWFPLIEANKGVEIFGTFQRRFTYQVDKKDREAIEIKLAIPVTFTVTNEETGKDEQVTIEAGEMLLSSLTGQVRYNMESEGVMPGATIYLRYEGKHDFHTWAVAFVNSGTGEVS